MFPPSCISYLAPEVIISLWAMALLLLEAFLELSPRVVASLALAGIALTLFITLGLGFDTSSTLFWGGMCRWDGAARFFDLFFLIVAALVIWMGDEAQAPLAHGGGEFVILPLFTTAGLMLLASANDFMLLFVALELVTISFYILVAYQRRSLVALEAGVKYLILGGLSSAFLVMGVAYIFGLTGTTRFDIIWKFYHLYGNPLTPGVSFGLLLVLTGVGFKIAMVPFHSWAPDVYEGAPNSITAFLSVGSKAGGLIILMRIVLGVFDFPAASVVLWIPLLTVCAIASLILGNFAAIPQRNLKRMLGYSSIGHTGFMLVAVIGASVSLTGKIIPFYTENAYGQITVEVYLISYLLATFAAFIVLAVLERRLPGLEIHHLAGLSQRSPLLAATFTLALVSMAGVPPLSGFIAKFYVILVAWHQGLYLLLGFVIFTAIAAFYYYLGPIKAMYWSEPLDETPIRLNRATNGVLIALIVLLIGTGFWAQSMFGAVNGALLADKNAPASAPIALVRH
ncbi:MAG TPA: NADH-quinone oxidoreductase subunit N [Candidatus Methylacidiphilales bacterium]|jgi:NADH-quinone oxidoreductase subunit N|nr:NADH-quinone oxidoreductase subunit N [Candidatus Methylacidiphilales bacterium]